MLRKNPSTEFKEMPDYIDGNSNTEAVYFGSITQPPLSDYLKSVHGKGKNKESPYWKNVFSPHKRYHPESIKLAINTLLLVITTVPAEQLTSEMKAVLKSNLNQLLKNADSWDKEKDKKLDGIADSMKSFGIEVPEVSTVEGWHYEKNKAFWAGAIEKGREFLLLTDIKDYKDNKIGGTHSELFWLEDNGYTFWPDPNNLMYTKAVPPSLSLRKPVTIIHYGHEGIVKKEEGTPDKKDQNNVQLMDRRMRTIKEDVLQKRQQLQTQIILQTQKEALDNSEWHNAYSKLESIGQRRHAWTTLDKDRKDKIKSLLDEGQYLEVQGFEQEIKQAERERKKQPLKTTQTPSEHATSSMSSIALSLSTPTTSASTILTTTTTMVPTTVGPPPLTQAQLQNPAPLGPQPGMRELDTTRNHFPPGADTKDPKNMVRPRR